MSFEPLARRDFDISVNWDTLLVCNQKCSYCYARPSRLWGRIQPKEITDEVIDALAKSNLKFKICLLGGEPTLHPRIWRIIEALQKLDSVKYIELFTNSKKVLNPKISNFEKLQINLSYHVTEDPDISIFKKNIDFCNLHHIPFKVFLMVVQDSKFLGKCKEVYDSLPNVICHYITTNDVTEAKVKFDDNEDLFRVNGKILKISEILSNPELHNFIGMNCDRSDYTINVDGTIDNMCVSNIGHIKNFTFRKNMVKCNRECSNACWMETKKW